MDQELSFLNGLYIGRLRVSGYASGTSSAQSPLLDNLVSYWKLDETGGTRLDSVGTRHMVPQGSISYYQGKITNGAFASGSSNYLTYSNAELNSLNWDNGFTVAGWIYVPSPYSLRNTIIEKGQTGGTADWSLYTNAQNQLRFEVADVSGTNSQAQSSSLLTTDEYHFFVGRYNPSTKRSEFRLDGNTSWITGATALNGVIRKAQSFLSIGTINGLYGKAVYCEVGLWMSYLSDANVDLLWNNGNGTTYPFTYQYSAPYITYLSRDDFTTSPVAPFIASPPTGGVGTRMMWPGPGSWVLNDQSGTFSLLSGKLYKASGTASNINSQPLMTGAYPVASTIGRALNVTVAPLLLNSSISILGDSLNYYPDSMGLGGYNKKIRFSLIGTGFYPYNLGNINNSFDPAISTYAQASASGSIRAYGPTNVTMVQAGQRFLYLFGNNLLYASPRSTTSLGYPSIATPSNAYHVAFDNFSESILPSPFDTEWSMAQTRLPTASSGTFITGERNGQVEATWTPTVSGQFTRLMFRYLDPNNYWAIEHAWMGGTAGVFNLVCRKNGVEAAIETSNPTTQTGSSYVISADFFNSYINTTINGQGIKSTSSGSFNMLETLCTVTRPVTNLAFWSPTVPAAHQAVLNYLTGTPTWTFNDTFNETTSREMTSHAPNIGSGSWLNVSQAGSYLGVSGGYAYRVSGSTVATYIINAGVSDYIFQGNMNSLSNGRQAILVRGDGTAGRYIICSFQQNTTNLRISISGGAWDVYDNNSFFTSKNTNYDFTVVCQGTNIHFIINGVAASISTNYNLGGTYVGIYSSAGMTGTWSNLRL